MADVTGPISSLPGATNHPPAGTMCDDHQDQPAVLRVQGETDSFGCEYIDMCRACAASWRRLRDVNGGADRAGNCSCGGRDVPVFPYRDYDEGMSGPVYWKCRSCLSAIRERERQELETDRMFEDEWFDDYGADDRDDRDDDHELEPLGWAIRYLGTSQRVSTRDGRRDLVFSVLRDAEKFVRRHRGKLRGRRIVIDAIWRA